MPTARDRIEAHGWDVVYVPHEDIWRYNACYRIELDGEVIFPPAADDLGIPLNEVWLSERWREYERYLLFHELREIQYRAAGLGKTEAHARAEQDELDRFGDEAAWREMNARWDAGRAHLPGADGD
jgi:competence protein ComEA